MPNPEQLIINSRVPLSGNPEFRQKYRPKLTSRKDVFKSSVYFHFQSIKPNKNVLHKFVFRHLN